MRGQDNNGRRFYVWASRGLPELGHARVGTHGDMQGGNTAQDLGITVDSKPPSLIDGSSL